MAKVFKLTHYIVDIEGDYDAPWISGVLECGLDAIVTLAHAEESDEFEWTDDNDLNHVYATLEEYEAYIAKGRR